MVRPWALFIVIENASLTGNYTREKETGNFGPFSLIILIFEVHTALPMCDLVAISAFITWGSSDLMISHVPLHKPCFALILRNNIIGILTFKQRLCGGNSPDSNEFKNSWVIERFWLSFRDLSALINDIVDPGNASISKVLMVDATLFGVLRMS